MKSFPFVAIDLIYASESPLTLITCRDTLIANIWIGRFPHGVSSGVELLGVPFTTWGRCRR